MGDLYDSLARGIFTWLYEIWQNMKMLKKLYATINCFLDHPFTHNKGFLIFLEICRIWKRLVRNGPWCCLHSLYLSWRQPFISFHVHCGFFWVKYFPFFCVAIQFSCSILRLSMVFWQIEFYSGTKISALHQADSSDYLVAKLPLYRDESSLDTWWKSSNQASPELR